MKIEKEIKEKLEAIKRDGYGKPNRELKSIAWHGTKQALEWVLEEKDSPLSY